MIWKVIEYSTNTGSYNMEYDLSLLSNCKKDTAFLRFYGWQPKCISLGANQSFDDIDLLLAKNNNIDVVKRPTGGRAILHADELTYSVVMFSEGISGRELYENISKAIVEGLKNLNNNLMDVELEENSPDFPDLLKNPSGSLCFASTAKSEIKYLGKKLVGSAQRKFGSFILQHGSILIGTEHKELVNYLKVDPDKKESLLREMEQKTTELYTITGQNIDIYSLQDNIISGFEKVLKSRFIRETLETC